MENIIEQMQMDMSLRDYSPKTIKSYQWHIRDLSDYFERPLDTLGQEDIRRYLYHVKTEKGYSNAYLSQAYSAIKYLYRNYFESPVDLRDLHGPRVALKLPVVLSQEEIRSLFDAAKNEKHRLLLMVIYSSGLRSSEAAHLQVSDIDSSSMRIQVRQGKGRKDRYTLLSPSVLERLRAYWRRDRPKTWLFFTRGNKSKAISTDTIRRVFHGARDKAGLNPDATVHSLRHSFATHLLNQGVNLFVIQKLLGHKHIQSTLIYLHLQNISDHVHSPIDVILEVTP
jgi:site-specific recombinase XerD